MILTSLLPIPAAKGPYIMLSKMYRKQLIQGWMRTFPFRCHIRIQVNLFKATTSTDGMPKKS